VLIHQWYDDPCGFDNFDLNLLIAFDVLMEERSVTRAAGRLNLTHSAVSASLKRLREAFHDEILVQYGQKMIPTAQAMELAPRVSEDILQLRSLISAGVTFDPATSQRRYRIEASDYITTILIVPLLAILQVHAPGIRLDLSLPDLGSTDHMVSGQLDLLLTPEQFLESEHPMDLLFEERHVVVGWSGNPLMQPPITESESRESGYVAVRIAGRETFIDATLREQGIQRRVEVTVPSFIQPSGTNRLLLMHERLAKILALGLSLTMAEPPIVLLVKREMMQYYGARSSDAALTWLRDNLLALASGAP
jgi:DNA-binding transcriptional LysR family regulator